MISSNYDLQAHTCSIPKQCVVFPRLLYSHSRCSQACCQHLQALPGASKGHCIRPVNSGIQPPCNSDLTISNYSHWLKVAKIHLAAAGNADYHESGSIQHISGQV